MAISLTKGQKINLKKDNGAALSKLMIGLGWDPVEQSSGGGGGFFSSLFSSAPDNIDCDAFVIMCKGGMLTDWDADCVYFGNTEHKTGAVQHMGDNLTGDGDGDDEQIMVNLDRVPADYDKLIFAVNIYKCTDRKQHFGMIANAFIRIVDQATGQEFCKYNLSEKYDGMTAMIFGEVYRYKGEWKFNAIGQGTKDTSVSEVMKRFI